MAGTGRWRAAGSLVSWVPRYPETTAVTDTTGRVAMPRALSGTVGGFEGEEFHPGSVVGDDPLAVTLLPLGDRMVRGAELDQGTPSRPYQVPFGLTRTTVPSAHPIELVEGSYDPVRQITVLPDGTPFIAAPSMKTTLYCSTLTTEDMQTWSDTVADGSD